MKKEILTAIAISALLISLMAIICSYPVRADSTDFIRFDSGVTIFSPINMTYNYRNLTLNLTVPVWSIIGMYSSVSMNYSIDGIYNGPVPLRDTTNPDAPPIITKVGMGAGSVDLPELPDGSHYLTIYLYGLNMQNYQPQFKSYVNTVYFSIDGPNSIFIPTPSPTPTPTLTPSPSPSLTPTPSPSPSLSPSSSPTPSVSPSSSPTQQPTIEPSPIAYGIQAITYTPAIIIIGLVIGTVVVGLLAYFAKHKGWK